MAEALVGLSYGGPIGSRSRLGAVRDHPRLQGGEFDGVNPAEVVTADSISGSATRR
jgi:hypothetical protein